MVVDTPSSETSNRQMMICSITYSYIYKIAIWLKIRPRGTSNPHFHSAAGTVNGRMSAGVEFTCALDNKSKAFCFGNNFDGQLGTGDTKRYTSPEPIASNLQWSSISAGDWHTCGLTTTGDAYCW